MHFGVFFILFCTANWLDVEGLNIEVGDNKWGGVLAPAHPSYHCKRCHFGVTENAGVENAIRAKLQGLKMQE